MRENESDSQDGWPGPYDYISPWAARDTDGAGRASAADADQASDRQDTIAFGSQASAGGDPGHDSYSQLGPSDPWYDGGRSESGYGSYAGPGGGFGSGGSGFGSGGSGFGSGGSGFGSGGGGWDPGPPARRGRGRGHLGVYLTVAVLAAGIGAGLTVAFGGQGSSPAASASSGDIPSPHDSRAAVRPGSGLNPAAVERKVKPGLVDITSQLKYASETAEGTGMILSPSGLVLTNNHVIDGATEVRVALADNTSQTYPARVVGYDYTDDVALLKLTGAAGLATVSFGDSSQVRVGTPVLALGDAQGRGGAIAAPGTISGLNRSIQASDEGSDTTEDLNHMLQTNAQIQQGDSGGALANNAGQVIGMITAANTGSGGQPGGTMGFAIPIDSALNIARQIASGKPTATVFIGLPGFLGVEVSQSPSTDPAQQARDAQQGSSQGGGRTGGLRGGAACVIGSQQPGVPRTIAPAGTGALILGILCGTAAQARGLAPGDVIVSVDGQAVTTPGSLTTITAEYHPAEVVSVTWEDTHGARHTARIKLGTGPAR
jgi:S1-C subfamily serine protease